VKPGTAGAPHLKKEAAVRFHLLLLALFSFLTPALGQKPAPATDALKQSLIKLEKQSWDAWQKRDGKFYRNFLSDDHVEMGSGGRSTKTEVADFVDSPVCEVKSYAVRDFELTMFNSQTALLTYHAEQDTTCHGKLIPSPVWISSLYVKRNGRWLNALYQQTNKP
jgi:hypothetical protein